MRFFVTAASGRELKEVLNEEKVPFQEFKATNIREMGTGSYPVFIIEANLPEVTSPSEAAQGEYSTRSFRLPSGRLIITDLEGNYEAVTTPSPWQA